MNKLFSVTSLALLLCVSVLNGCDTDAQVVSHNISLEAGDFQIVRRIVFYNGITGTYILTIEGRCQVEHGVEHGDELAVTCKTSENSYKKHYLGLSDNVTYFVEQLVSVTTNAYRYKVIFKPETILPDIDLKTSSDK